MHRLTTGCSWVSAVVGLAGFASGANAEWLFYEMNVSPAAEAVPMTLQGDGDGFGDTGAGGNDDRLSPYYSGIQDGTHGPAGTARFVDSGVHGNDGFTIQGFPSGWTVDMRISVETSTGGSNFARAMGIRTANGNGRAISFLNAADSGNTGNGFRFQIRSTGILDQVDVPNNPVNTTTFHSIRIVLPNDGHLLLYDLEAQTDGHWNLLMDSSGINGTIGTPFELNNLGGFALNSLANNSTTSSQYSLDWLRIENSCAIGGLPIMIGLDTGYSCLPEPTTLVMLVMSAIPLGMRRRPSPR